LKKAIIAFFSIAVFSAPLFAVGQSAVITLVYSAGAENTGLGECGVSHAKNVYTLFWNPANLPAVYDETFVNVMTGHFREDLLPVFKIPDLYHTFTPLCLLLNDIVPHIDLSYGYFNNFINFGVNDITDEQGRVTDSAQSDETVRSYSFAVQAWDLISAGISFKHYESRLAPGIGIGDDGIATGNAYDIGFRCGRRIPVFDIIEFQPSIGVSFLNLWGDSAQYIHDRAAPTDPIPKTIIYGGSLGINILEIFEYTYMRENDRSMVAHSWDEINHHYGERFQITPFYCSIKGKLDDPAGQRFERTTGHVVTFNFRKTLNMVLKISHLYDRLHHSNTYEKIAAWDEKLWAGRLQFKPNIYYSSAYSTIHASEDEARNGQTRKDWSIGIGVVGSFSSLFSRELPKKNVRQIKADAPATPEKTLEIKQKENSSDSTKTGNKNRTATQEDLDHVE
jgi:hypothetical protein